MEGVFVVFVIGFGLVLVLVWFGLVWGFFFFFLVFVYSLSLILSFPFSIIVDGRASESQQVLCAGVSSQPWRQDPLPPLLALWPHGRFDEQSKVR
jgi:hypothetical protein